jgi:hypothetical protein
MKIHFGAKWHFDVDINEWVNLGLAGREPSLSLYDQVVKIVEGWVEKKL